MQNFTGTGFTNKLEDISKQEIKSVKEALEILNKLEDSFEDYHHQTQGSQKNIKLGHTSLENQMKFFKHHINEFIKNKEQLEKYLKSMPHD